MLPAFAQKMGLPYSNREGWLSGSFARLIQEPGNGENLVDLAVACPVPAEVGNCSFSYPVSDFGEPDAAGTVHFYGFLENLNAPEVYDRSLETRFREILADYQPDMVHIFGTEFPHALAMVRSFRDPERTLVGIQGLCCSIAAAYMADLPYKVQKRVTFRDWYRRDSLEQQQHKFQIRARNEAHALPTSRGGPPSTGGSPGRSARVRSITRWMRPCGRRSIRGGGIPPRWSREGYS